MIFLLDDNLKPFVKENDTVRAFRAGDESNNFEAIGYITKDGTITSKDNLLQYNGIHVPKWIVPKILDYKFPTLGKDNNSLTRSKDDFYLIDEYVYCKHVGNRIRVEMSEGPVFIWESDKWKWRKLCQ